MEGNLPANERPPVPGRFNAVLFFTILLAPGLLTLLSAQTKAESFTQFFPLIGGGIAGIFCGVVLAFRSASSIAGRIICSILFIPLLALVSLGMGVLGCSLGGGSAKM